MADQAINPGPGNGSANGLTLNQGAARLAPFGTSSGAPQPERQTGQPPPERLSLRPEPETDYASEPGPDDTEHRQEPELEPEVEADEAPQPQGIAPDTVLWATDDGTKVTLSEAREGYLRQEDYRRKTSLVSEGRRQLESQHAELSADREAVASFILRSLPDLSPERIAREQMSGEQVYRLQAESQQLLGFVGQLRQQTATQRQQLEAHEIEQARSLAGEIIEGWHDPKRMEADITATRAFLDKAGVPPATQAKLARDPWLAKLAVDAGKFSQVRLGGSRGREAQRSVSPTLPAQDQAPPASGGPRERLRQSARGGTSMRQRHDAAAELLRGVPIRR